MGNIFLNFDPSDKLILVGRLGMGLTLMGGMPMSLLPCREAFFSLLTQIETYYSKDFHFIGENHLLHETNFEVEFGLNDMNEKKGLLLKSTSATCHSAPSLDYSSMEQINNKLDRMETGSTLMEIQMDMESSASATSINNNNNKEIRSVHVHVLVTLAFAVFGYIGAVYVPGVEYVWRILGSSMGMIIAFIVPSMCYLKIRGHRGVRRTVVCTFLLLIFSMIAAFICTIEAIS